MVKDAKGIFLAGVGAAALTYERASEVVCQLVEKGKLTVEEGKDLSEELKRNVKNTAVGIKEAATEKMGSMKPLTKEELKSVLEEMNYATKADIVEIKRLLERLEEKIK